MKNYIQPGHTITLTAPYAVASGDGLLVDALFAVASGDAAAGDPVEAVATGVFDLAKPTGQGWSPGQPIHWDDTAKACTTVAAGNTPIGAALADGDINALAEEIAEAVREGIIQRFTVAHDKRQVAETSVEQGREYVKAYVQLTHFVEASHYLASQGASHKHREDKEPGQ